MIIDGVEFCYRDQSLDVYYNGRSQFIFTMTGDWDDCYRFWKTWNVGRWELEWGVGKEYAHAACVVKEYLDEVLDFFRQERLKELL